MINLQDLKHALRLLAKKPGFTVLTTLIMAVGIGLSVYQFSFLNTLIYKDLSFKDSESLVIINSMRDGMLTGAWIKLHDLEELRSRAKGIVEFTAYKDKSINISGRDMAQRYTATYAEPNVFKLSRTAPLLGRSFTEEENLKGAENVIVLGYDLWQNKMGGDPNVVDQSIRVNGIETRIIGVMPRGYFFPINSDAWLPLKQDVNQITRDNSPSVGGLAHLQPGTSMDNLNQQLNEIMGTIAIRYPDSNNGVSAVASTIPMMSMKNGGQSFVIAMYVVAVLLLILASINVGNLLLARAVERSKETAIRVALGAPRMRIVNQMLSESILICCTGGLVGLLLASWMLESTTEQLAALSRGANIYWLKFGLDGFTLSVFFVFLLSTILVTGFLPAWKNSGANFNAVLRDGTRGALGKKAGRLNIILVVSEVFLSITVLIITSVIVTGTYSAINAEYGVNANKKLVANISLPEDSAPEAIAEFANDFQVSMQQSPNLINPTITTALPGRFTWSASIAIDGQEYADDNTLPRANYVAVMPSFFKSLDIKLISGRYFDASDEGLGKRTVIITQSLADTHFPGQNVLGQRVRIAETDGDTPKWLTIVGVVKHTVYAMAGFTGTEQGAIFRSLTQAPRHNLTIVTGMVSGEQASLRAVQEILADIDPDLALFDVSTYEKAIEQNTAGLLFMSRSFAIFAIVALGLAACGIYGVMSNTVIRRTQETGVKRALGACEATITKAFLWQGSKQLLWGAIPGMIVGSGVGFAITKLMSIDNTMLGLLCVLVSVIIGIVVMFATYLPVKDALNMEPSQALRHE